MIKLRNGVPDAEIFEKQILGSVQVDVTQNGMWIKQQMISLYEKKSGERLDPTTIMLRNPNFDIGQLIRDSDKVENMYLFDGKELYLQ